MPGVTKEKIIIDCDPGQDDAINLLLAMSSPETFDILGVTAVAGNVPLALTERNARLMCDIGFRDDVNVYAGCSRPMQRDLLTAEKVHGSTGIDGMEITDPVQPLQQVHAVDFIVETLADSADDSVILVPTAARATDVPARYVVDLRDLKREAVAGTPLTFQLYTDSCCTMTTKCSPT